MNANTQFTTSGGTRFRFSNKARPPILPLIAADVSEAAMCQIAAMRQQANGISRNPEVPAVLVVDPENS